MMWLNSRKVLGHLKLPNSLITRPKHLAKLATTQCPDCTGTVAPYETHVFTSLDTHWRDWPRRLEFTDPFFRALNISLDIRKKGPIRLTGFHLPNKAHRELLVFNRIFPGGLRLILPNSSPESQEDPHVLGMAGEDAAARVHSLLEDFSSEHVDWAPISNPVTFICAHYARDERCGNFGGQVLNNLQGLIRHTNDMKNADDSTSVRVFACSHIGGHRYAGNTVSFPAGIWLGNLDAHQPELMKQVLRATTFGGDHWKQLEGHIRGHVWETE